MIRAANEGFDSEIKYTTLENVQSENTRIINKSK